MSFITVTVSSLRDNLIYNIIFPYTKEVFSLTRNSVLYESGLYRKLDICLRIKIKTKNKLNHIFKHLFHKH